jgi:hypothetical protein
MKKVLVGVAVGALLGVGIGLLPGYLIFDRAWVTETALPRRADYYSIRNREFIYSIGALIGLSAGSFIGAIAGATQAIVEAIRRRPGGT